MKKEINLALIRERRLKRGFSNEDMAKSLGLASSDKYFLREHCIYKIQASELPALSNSAIFARKERRMENFNYLISKETK